MVLEDEDWNLTIDTNLTGPQNVLRVFSPSMVARKLGRIIITTSSQGSTERFMAQLTYLLSGDLCSDKIRSLGTR
jgi:NAD(P)-dependent dehydrogenase (short-subunit alcohol dehydrogenase family)